MADADSIAQFVNVTGSTPEQASQFLEASNGDLTSALSTFFEVQAGQEEDVDAASGGAPSAADDSHYTGPRTLDGRPAAASEPWPSQSSSSNNNPPRRTGIATLGSSAASAGAFRQGPSAPAPHPDSDDEQQPGSGDDEDDDDKQDLYAGGGRSGLNVEDPNRRRNGRKMVDEIIKKAQKNGPLEPKAPPAGPSWFGGSANTLGSDEAPSQHIPSAAGEEDPEDDEVVTRRLTLWANGFNIDDGPLMDYQQHAEVLRDLNSGRAPLELLNVKFGQRVDLQVQKRLEEPFVPEKVAAKPFGGEGNRLGAPAPALGAAAASTSQQAPAAPANPAPSSTSFEVNASQPVTSIQIRLGNGDRMVGRFNHTHTVGDVMGYINASHPGASARPYVLQTTFPSRDLTDRSQTVKDAGLLSSVVVCKYI